MDKMFVDSELRPGTVEEIGGYNRHHLNVAGFSTGDSLIIGDTNFREFNAEIIKVTRDKFEVQVKNEIKLCRVPLRKVSLFVSLPKKKKMEEIIFKSTQLGVREFVPILTSRTVKILNPRQHDKNYSRWNKKARQGAELSMRKNIPVIRELTDFKEALKIYKEENLKSGIIFWEQNSGQKYVAEKDLSGNMAVFVGPEGGFSSEEVGLASDSGLKIRTLGSLILEVETAVIAGLSLILCGGS